MNIIPNKYIIISGAYNEEAYIDRTIKSVIKQTILPQEWIIVNDGSTDQTAEIVEKYIKEYSWIKLFNFEKEAVEFGTHAVVNFYKGFKRISESWDFIVKLDTDLDIDSPIFFQYQINEFHKNPDLGISSGITYSMHTGDKVLTSGRPEWRTGGAMKMYRKKCLEEIKGLKPIYGWDGLDEYQAMYYGWETKTFFNLHVNHLGKKRALTRAKEKWLSANKGRSYFLRGYPIEFVFIKGLALGKRSTTMMTSFLKGYFLCYFQNEKPLVTKGQKKFIRKFQYKRLFNL